MSSIPCFSLIQWIDHHAKTRPSEVAWFEVVGDSIHEFTWKDMQCWIDAIAHQLAAFNVQQGNRVCSRLPNSAAWIVLEGACSALGAVHCPIDTRIPFAATPELVKWLDPTLFVSYEAKLGSETRQEFQGALSCPHATIPLSPWEESSVSQPSPENSDTTSRPHDHDFRFVMSPEKGSPIRSGLNPSDVATILLTSGSSGKRKGVELTHENLIRNALGKLDAMPQKQEDVRLNLLPFAHAYARTCELTTWAITGGSLACARSIDHFLEIAPRLKPMLVNAVPLFYERLLKESLRQEAWSAEALKSRLGDRIRMLASGGAGLPEETFHEFARIGFPIYQGYGLTETSPVVCSNRVEHLGNTNRPAKLSIGTPIQDVEVKIDDEGELWVRGPNLMRGYFRDSEETNRRLVNGWLRTGDLARQLEDGAYQIFGRRDDVIVLSNGFKVSPQELEKRLKFDPDFRSCAVTTDVDGEIVLVVSIPEAEVERIDDPSLATSLLAKCHQLLHDLPSHEHPRRVLLFGSPFSLQNRFLTMKGELCRPAIREWVHKVETPANRDQLRIARASSRGVGLP